MNNAIIISRTFATITPESAEYGDFNESGFISEREEVTFTELCELMQSHYHASTSGEVNTRTWFSTDFEHADYTTGEQEQQSIHFHQDNTPNAAKYWKWAANYAKSKRGF